MSAIGLTLEDLGIASKAAPRPAYVPDEFPKEYDFTLDLFLHRGSWREMRTTLRDAVTEAYSGDVPLHFSIFWTEMEGETEESIRASLTGARYDKKVHKIFKARIVNWAETETDTALINHAITDPEARRLLLQWSPNLEPQVLRNIYGMVKDEEGGDQAFIEAESEIPDDVLEVIAKGHYPADSQVLHVLILRYETTEQMLLDMVGKGVDEEILSEDTCTDAVRKAVPDGRRILRKWGVLSDLTREGAIRLAEALNDQEFILSEQPWRRRAEKKSKGVGQSADHHNHRCQGGRQK